MIFTLLSTLISLTGPDGQIIQVNPQDVTSLRTIRNSEHFAPGVHCNVFMTDGKNVGVVEDCKKVHDLLEGWKP